MRPVTLTDLNAAARVLLPLPEARRATAMKALIARADLADRHRLATGSLHPVYGNGTLLAAALVHPHVPPGPGDESAFLGCLGCAIDGVLTHRATKG